MCEGVYQTRRPGVAVIPRFLISPVLLVPLGGKNRDLNMAMTDKNWNLEDVCQLTESCELLFDVSASKQESIVGRLECSRRLDCLCRLLVLTCLWSKMPEQYATLSMKGHILISMNLVVFLLIDGKLLDLVLDTFCL